MAIGEILILSLALDDAISFSFTRRESDFAARMSSKSNSLLSGRTFLSTEGDNDFELGSRDLLSRGDGIL
jgi:hypothetical protein